MHVSSALVACALTIALSAPLSVRAQEQDDQPRFRASVDVVTIAAVVRDKQGRVVSSLTKDDFTVLDEGTAQPIVEFQPDSNGPISIGLLIDGSGSMRPSSGVSRRAAETLLALLNAHSDDVALMSFDTRLLTHRQFTSDFQQLRSALNEVECWGATSAYDAIAGAARIVSEHTRKRRAVLVVTDGSDNWSTYSASEVAWIASTIDVPIYVFSLASPSNVAPLVGRTSPVLTSPLADLARATGGELFVAESPALISLGIRRLLEELRHQYVIAFESSTTGGLREIEIKTRKPELRVKSRKWYSASSGE